MRALGIAITTIIVLVAATHRPAAAQFAIDGYAAGDLDQFDAAARSYMQAEGIPNGSVAVVAGDGRLVLARAYTNFHGGHGTAAPYSNDGVQRTRLTSRFRVASVSKLFTAAAILQLTEYGCFADLDERIAGHVPIIGMFSRTDRNAGRVTLRGLLTHHHGWIGWRSDGTIMDPTKNDFAVRDGLGLDYLPVDHSDIILHTTRTTNASLSSDVYANYGYLLLGRAIEAVSGVSYESYVRRHILGRSGATGALLGHTLLSQRHPGEARYYERNAKTEPSVVETTGDRPRPYGGSFNLENRDANGGWIASSLDLVLFARDFMSYGPSNIFRNAGTVTEMFRRRGTVRGYGWQVEQPWTPGDRWHTGHMEGNHALLYCYSSNNPDPRLADACVAMLFNKSRRGSGNQSSSVTFFRQSVTSHLPGIANWGTTSLWADAIGGPPPRRTRHIAPSCSRGKAPGVVN